MSLHRKKRTMDPKKVMDPIVSFQMEGRRFAR